MTDQTSLFSICITSAVLWKMTKRGLSEVSETSNKSTQVQAPKKDDESSWIDISEDVKFGPAWIGFQRSKSKVNATRYAARCCYCKTVINEARPYRLFEHIQNFKKLKCTMQIDKQKEYLW
jgi:hypothetical protein